MVTKPSVLQEAQQRYGLTQYPALTCGMRRMSMPDIGFMTGILSCRFYVSIAPMKLSRLLLILALVALSAYMISTWLGFDDRLAVYGVKHAEALRAAAEKGDVKSQFRLASTYSRGLGIKKNDSEALKWYQRAADQGYARAQYNLGMMYYFGKGVPQNNVIGYQWVILAANRGEQTARKALIALAKKIPSEQIVKARAAAQAWGQAHDK